MLGHPSGGQTPALTNMDGHKSPVEELIYPYVSLSWRTTPVLLASAEHVCLEFLYVGVWKHPHGKALLAICAWASRLVLNAARGA